jgi:hypothetical protein
MLRVPVRRGGSGGGGGVAGIGGTSRGGGTGARLGNRTGRSRQAAAAVGARAIGAALAYANRDGESLAELGLDLGELDNLEPIERCQKMMDLFDGAATIADGERRRAAANTLITILETTSTMSAEDGVRLFCGDYIFQVLTTEIGREMRSDPASGVGSRTLEADIRQFINAVISTTPLPRTELGGTVSLAVLERVIADTLTEARSIYIRRDA